jgi:hypothetical protein
VAAVSAGIELDYRPLCRSTSANHGAGDALRAEPPGALWAQRPQILYRIGDLGRLPIHAVEITDTGAYQAHHDVELIRLPKIATDDSHVDYEFGRAWVEVDAARSPDAIIRAIKAGDFRVGFASAPPPVRGRGFDLLDLSQPGS